MRPTTDQATEIVVGDTLALYCGDYGAVINLADSHHVYRTYTPGVKWHGRGGAGNLDDAKYFIEWHWYQDYAGWTGGPWLPLPGKELEV